MNSPVRKYELERRIVDELLTDRFIAAEYDKFVNICGWDDRYLQRFMTTVFFGFIRDESWIMIMRFDFPKIDYRNLRIFCDRKVEKTLVGLLAC